MENTEIMPCFACHTAEGARQPARCYWCNNTGVIDIARRRAEQARMRAHMEAEGFVLLGTVVVDLSGADAGGEQ